MTFFLLLLAILSGEGFHIFILFFTVLIINTAKFYPIIKISKAEFIVHLFVLLLTAYNVFVNYGRDIDINAYIAIPIYSLAYWLLVKYILMLPKSKIVRNIRSVGFLIVLTVVCQYVIYILFGYYADLHILISLGSEQSRSLNNFQFLNIGIRATSFFAEPGNLAMVLFGIATILAKFGFIKSGKKIVNLSPVSLSFTSVFLVIIYNFHNILLRTAKKYNNKIIIGFFILMLLFVLIVILFYLTQIDFGYNAFGWRLIVFDRIFDRPLFYTIFGDGALYVNSPVDFNGLLLIGSNVNEVGVISILFSYGVFGILLLFSIIRKARINFGVFIFFFMFMLTKVSLNIPIFWFVIWILLLHVNANLDSSSRIKYLTRSNVLS